MNQKLYGVLRVLVLLFIEALAILYFYSEFPVGEIRAIYEDY